MRGKYITLIGSWTLAIVGLLSGAATYGDAAAFAIGVTLIVGICS